MDELASLLASCPGDSPVVLELTRPGDFVVRMQARSPRAVKTDDQLLDRLRRLCGDEAVRLEKQSHAA